MSEIEIIQIGAAVIVAGLFLLLLMAERLRPLRARKRRSPRRYAVNAILTVLAFLAGIFAVRPVTMALSELATGHRLGLLHVIALPAALQFILAFLLMDLSFYYWHRLNHRVPFLWRFHNIHHIDPDLDATTSFRFHFGEVFLSVGFRAVQVLVIGISPLAFVIYEICFQSATIFHHSNFRLPYRLEWMLNRVFVTPRMHGIHHSSVREETDSNYSVIFRWWDALHRSLNIRVRQEEVVIGVPAYLDESDNRVTSLVALPFRHQRDHWRLPDGSRPRRETPGPVPELA